MLLALLPPNEVAPREVGSSSCINFRLSLPHSLNTMWLCGCMWLQNDPSVPEGAGPDLSPQKAEALQQDESSGT